MPPQVAALIMGAGILGLFWLESAPHPKTSKALWIPTLWLLINGSRPVSQWLAAAGLNTGSQLNSADLYLEGSPIDRNVFTVLLAAGLIVLISRSRVVAPLLAKNAPILFFFGYCAMSIAWSDYPFVTFKHWTKGIGDVVMVLVVVTDPEADLALKLILARTGFLLVPLSVLFIKYYPDLGQEYNQWTWMQEYVGVTTTKNMLGMMALIFGVGFVWRLLAALRDREDIYRKRRLIAYGTLLAMALWLLSMAHSTTSLTCFLMGSALLVVTGMRMPPRKATIIHLLVATMIAVAFFALFIDAGGGLVESLGKDPTLTGRTAIWDLVLRLTGNPVIGTGYESFWLGERLQKVWDVYRGIQEAHNGYLEVFLNLGWIGITLLTGILVTGYRNAIVTYQRNPESGSIRLAYFVIAVVYSFTEAGFRMQFPVWICFLLATIRLPEVTPSDGRVAARMTPAGIFEEQEQVLTAFS